MKKLLAVMAAGVMALSMSVTALAGSWQKDSVGWWYDNGDGTYQRNGWFQDTDGKYYYFNPAGYMLSNTTTPDGYYVDASGAWVTGAQSAKQAKSLSGSYYTGKVYSYSGNMEHYYEDTHNRYLMKLEDVYGDGSCLNFNITEVNYRVVAPISGVLVRKGQNSNYALGTEYAVNSIKAQGAMDQMTLFSVQDNKIEIRFEFEEEGEQVVEVYEFAR